MNRALSPSGWIALLASAVRAEELFAVGADRRFLASERRHLRGAARAAMLVILASAALDVVAFSAIHDSETPLIVGLNLGIGLLAFGGFVALRGAGRRHPEAVVSVMSLVVAWASVVLGIRGTELAVLAVGYLLILPAIVTLVVPSRPWAHALWLLGYAVAAFGFLLMAPAASLSQRERADLAVILVVAIAASFVGSVLRFRARARAHMQFVAMQALRHEAEMHRRALSRARTDLELLVRVDQLTEVGNRRRLQEDLVAARARLDRTGEPFGLLEIDLDHFKKVNDRSGHLVGDTVLHDVAQIFKRASRATDVVYRFGGEEFVVLLPGADTAATQAAAERLRSAVEDASIEHPANEPTGVVTVSVGGMVIRPSDLDQTDEAWLVRADRALYRAKAEGRNRVVMETCEA